MRISKVRGKESKRSIIDRRVNELNCIYGLAESIRAQDTLPEVFRDVPRLVESAWQHPEIIRCKVTFDGEQYIMKPFKETRRRELADILVWGEARGKMILKQEPLNLLSIVKDAIQSVTATREKHEVVIDIPKDLPAVSGDRGRLIQVLVNLLDNAIKYNPYGGKVNVIAHQDLVRDQVVVSVSDQGIGIAPEDQKKLFTTFHRIRRPETENSRGTGMGLYIVKALVELMGGEIWVKSELNKGSTFSFSVPTFNLA